MSDIDFPSNDYLALIGMIKVEKVESLSRGWLDASDYPSQCKYIGLGKPFHTEEGYGLLRKVLEVFLHSKGEVSLQCDYGRLTISTTNQRIYYTLINTLKGMREELYKSINN